MSRYVLFTLLLLLTGCAGWPWARTLAPDVSISQVELTRAGLLEQQYRILLRVQNPNAVDLPIRGLGFEVHINGRRFLRGVSDTAVTIPAYDERVLEVDGVSTLGAVLEQLRSFAGGADTVRYRVSGHFTLSNRPGRWRFESLGEVPLAAPRETDPPA